MQTIATTGLMALLSNLRSTTRATGGGLRGMTLISAPLLLGMASDWLRRVTWSDWYVQDLNTPPRHPSTLSLSEALKQPLESYDGGRRGSERQI